MDYQPGDRKYDYADVEAQPDPDASPQPSPGEGSKTLEKFDVLSKFWVGLAGLALSAAIGFSTVSFNRQTTERQANVQIEALALQRRTSAAQVELGLLPTFAKGTDSERKLALSILTSIAPDEAARIGAVLIPQLNSEVERREATALVASVSENRQQQEFRQRLQSAAIYRQFSLDANACREYFAAFENLPAGERKVVASEIDSARAQYSQGHFSDAAARLEAALTAKY
jgi:hypothetical protein